MSDFMTKVDLSPLDLNIPLTYQHDLTLRYSSGDPLLEAEEQSCHRLLDFLSREISQETTDSSLIEKYSPKPLLYRKQLSSLLSTRQRTSGVSCGVGSSIELVDLFKKREKKALGKAEQRKRDSLDPELLSLIKSVSA
jgi:hypothetical protein